jgi:predicted phosphodiesterase
MIPKIPLVKMRLPIVGTEAILNVTGDFHLGASNVEKSEIVDSLNRESTEHKGNIFRIFTGDLMENQLKTSVGHNYDPSIADPSVQKTEVVDILKRTNEELYAKENWSKLSVNQNAKNFEGVRSVGVEGNHEYRTRKLAGQWLMREVCSLSKTLYLGIHSIIELTIYNKKLKMEKVYRIYVAHRPSKTDATSVEAILRAFRRKQSMLPGVDVIVFGHFHRRFISPEGYFDARTNEFRKILFVTNPSPLCNPEYSDEAGYPPIETGFSVNVSLPLYGQPWGVI